MAQTKVSLIKDGVIVVGHLHTNHGITTGHIGEGSNLYFTDARVMTSLGSVSTHIIPDTDITYDLGSATNRFRDLYLSGSTIHLGGDTKISVNNDGEVEFKDSSDAPKRLKVRELDFVDDQGRNKRFKIDATSGKLATFDAAGTLTADKLDLSAMSTTDLAEGSNLYYTDARVGAYLTTNNYATQSYVQGQVSSLVSSAPATLDTLKELAAALGDDPNFATTVSGQIGTKWTQDNAKIANWDAAYGWGNHASVGYLTTVGWNDVTGKPATFTPSAHNHDDRYYTESESDARFINASGDTMTGTLTLSSISGTDQVVENTYGAYLHLGAWAVGRTASNAVLVNTAYRADYADALFDMNISRFTNDAGYQLASSAITTSNIGSQSVNYANSAGSVAWGNVSGKPSTYDEAYALDVVDTRSGQRMPTDVPEYRVSAEFTNQITSGWHSLINVKGWHDGYATWQLIGGSDTSSHNNLYFRSGVNSSWGSLNTIWHSGNDGSGSGLDADLLDGQQGSYYINTSNIGSQSVNYASSAGNADTLDGIDSSSFFRDNQDRRLKVLRFTGEGGDSGNSSNLAYAIYQEGGAWSYPYPDLRIAMHTGIKFGANASYNGMRFYTDYDMSSQVMSVNNGSDPLGGGNVYVNNSLQAGSSLRAPVFYDSNDTNWWIDPAASSSAKFRQFVQIGDSSSYNTNSGTWGARLNVTDNVHAKIDVAQDANGMHSHWFAHTGQSSIKFGTTSAHGVEFVSNNQGRGHITSGGTLEWWNNVSAPIYYDYNNTGYYIDPASTSNLNKITLGSQGITGAITDLTSALIDTAYNNAGTTNTWYPLTRQRAQYSSGYITHLVTGLHKHASGWGGGRSGWFAAVGGSDSYPTQEWRLTYDGYLYNSLGYVIQEGSFRAPIFYDSNDTNLYVDPSSTSVLNYVTATEYKFRSSTNNARFNGVSDWGTRLYTDSGYIQFGPANSGHAHIYTDRSNFYFNRQLQVNGGSLINTDDVRSQTFYDVGDTGFYMNPAGDNRMHTIISNYFERANHHIGHLVGSYNNIGDNSGYTNPIYTIGSSYNPAVSTLSNMYGIGYSHNNASFINMTGASGWGMYVAADGDARVYLDGSNGRVSATGASYIPVYYDYSDTGYYVDPASTSRLLYTNVNEYRLPNGFTIYQGGSNYGQFNSWVHLPGHHGFYSSLNGAHIYPNNATYGSWRIDGTRNGWGGIHFGTGMTLMMNNTECGFHREGDGWYIYSSSKNLYSPGDVTAYWSDRRLKKNIKPITNGLEKTLALVPCEFEWNEKANAVNENLYDGKKEVSLIAQEVQEIIPDAVTENLSAKGNDEETYLTIKYDKIVPYLIQAIKEQQAQIDELKKLVSLHK